MQSGIRCVHPFLVVKVLIKTKKPRDIQDYTRKVANSRLLIITNHTQEVNERKV